jgi:hypothetical protein
MKITTSKGKAFNIGFICSPLSTPEHVIIETSDTRPFSEIAADFEGLEIIKKEDDTRESSVYEMYEGFSRLVEMHRYADGSVRLTLEKE